MRENSPGRAVGQFQNRYPGRTGVGDCAGSSTPPGSAQERHDCPISLGVTPLPLACPM